MSGGAVEGAAAAAAALASASSAISRMTAALHCALVIVVAAAVLLYECSVVLCVWLQSAQPCASSAARASSSRSVASPHCPPAHRSPLCAAQRHAISLSTCAWQQYDALLLLSQSCTALRCELVACPPLLWLAAAIRWRSAAQRCRAHIAQCSALQCEGNDTPAVHWNRGSTIDAGAGSSLLAHIDTTSTMPLPLPQPPTPIRPANQRRSLHDTRCASHRHSHRSTPLASDQLLALRCNSAASAHYLPPARTTTQQATTGQPLNPPPAPHLLRLQASRRHSSAA